MPARVTEPAGPRGLAAHVAIVEHRQLVGQQLGDGVDVTADVGDDPNSYLIGDVPHRVWMRPGAVALARTAGGMVTIERGSFSSPKVTLRDAASGRELGVFESGWLEGGRLRLCSGREWRWHMDACSMSRWSFRDDTGQPVAIKAGLDPGDAAEFRDRD